MTSHRFCSAHQRRQESIQQNAFEAKCHLPNLQNNQTGLKIVQMFLLIHVFHIEHN
jgi:hypothetical protein